MNPSVINQMIKKFEMTIFEFKTNGISKKMTKQEYTADRPIVKERKKNRGKRCINLPMAF